MAVYEVKNIQIGAGMPKIIIPVMGATTEDVVASARKAVEAQAGCIEWRADYFPTMNDAAVDETCLWIAETAQELASVCAQTPVLFTIRTAGQGGNADISTASYLRFVKAALVEPSIDLVDIEINTEDTARQELIEAAHAAGKLSVVSYHNFTETPDTTWMISELCRMRELGGDIPKMAVMAKNTGDTLRLLSATNTVSEERGITPLITMAMGAGGAISRLTGEAFGSSMTFASLEAASAPGQVDLAHTRAVLTALNEALGN